MPDKRVVVIFQDLDGVCNSKTSFRLEQRKGTENISDTLSEINCSNFQSILDAVPDAKIVISSSWRILHSFDYLKTKLTEYRIDAGKVIGVTPCVSSGDRAREITLWLEEHPEVTHYVILDDDSDILSHGEHAVLTTWEDGLLSTHVKAAIKILKKT